MPSFFATNASEDRWRIWNRLSFRLRSESRFPPIDFHFPLIRSTPSIDRPDANIRPIYYSIQRSKVDAMLNRVETCPWKIKFIDESRVIFNFDWLGLILHTFFLFKSKFWKKEFEANFNRKEKKLFIAIYKGWHEMTLFFIEMILI